MLIALFDIDIFSVSSLLYYISVYGFINFGALAFIMFMEKNSTLGIEINQLKGLYTTRPLYALCLTWFLFNLAGLPPTAGFFAKLFIFESLVKNEFWWMLFWAVIGSAVALYYYLKPVAIMYTESKTPPFFENIKEVKESVILHFICSIILIAVAGWFFTWIKGG